MIAQGSSHSHSRALLGAVHRWNSSPKCLWQMLSWKMGFNGMMWTKQGSISRRQAVQQENKVQCVTWVSNQNQPLPPRGWISNVKPWAAAGCPGSTFQTNKQTKQLQRAERKSSFTLPMSGDGAVSPALPCPARSSKASQPSTQPQCFPHFAPRVSCMDTQIFGPKLMAEAFL